MPPCRVTLRDALPGEVSILLHWEHHAAPTSPYRASGPIFVRQGATETASFVNRVPEQQRIRLLSVRAYDADGFMLTPRWRPALSWKHWSSASSATARWHTCAPTMPGAAATPAASIGPESRARTRCVGAHDAAGVDRQRRPRTTMPGHA